MGTSRKAKRAPAKARSRKPRPTAAQRAEWDRAHAERQRLINAPFMSLRRVDRGSSYPWAGVLVPREAELIKDNAMGAQSQYNGVYSGDLAVDWDTVVNSYEGGS